MTNAQPLWSDERIEDAIQAAWTAAGQTYQYVWIRQLLRQMRGEYEKKLAAQQAQERWEPVENGDYNDVLVHNDQLSITFYDHLGMNQTDTFLPDDLRLCRRIEPHHAQQRPAAQTDSVAALNAVREERLAELTAPDVPVAAIDKLVLLVELSENEPYYYDDIYLVRTWLNTLQQRPAAKLDMAEVIRRRWTNEGYLAATETVKYKFAKNDIDDLLDVIDALKQAQPRAAPPDMHIRTLIDYAEMTASPAGVMEATRKVTAWLDAQQHRPAAQEEE